MTKVGIRSTRVFDGAEYRYKMTFTGPYAKNRAKMFARSYKKDGYRIRVLKTLGGYSVYVSKHQGWYYEQEGKGEKWLNTNQLENVQGVVKLYGGAAHFAETDIGTTHAGVGKRGLGRISAQSQAKVP